MGKYYALVAGLPVLSADGQKLPYEQEEFYLELQDVLSSKDKELLEWLHLEDANRELLRLHQEELLLVEQKQDEDTEQIDTLLPLEELRHIARTAAAGGKASRSKQVPNYMRQFVHELYYEPQDEDEAENLKKSPLSAEDRLAQLYYAEASKSSNQYLADWFRLNQTIRNVMAVYTCRRLGWPIDQFVVGNSHIEEQLRTSRAKDFELGEEVPYMPQIIQAAEEEDITRRERMIDMLKWRWLDDETFVKVFDIENVLSYYIRLGIIERWLKLDEKQGETRFRSIVMGLKAESNASLDEFRRSTKK
ncbi:DUF2764 family protein [Porphyromonas sp. COT-290 OH3588]|uniref:DUF2764 family protein n=1 Tax=Porphyromonas sp. COT-290 OH3588 TaxID=1515617 RepID=UPI00052B69B6|nr:DUF2764 family protein [Porphyromonas sp. COT-290 OH3588]KGO01506.1 hypothetical protein HQ48_01370 [Porphyromonas sp. COT-290 OH3588]